MTRWFDKKEAEPNPLRMWQYAKCRSGKNGVGCRHPRAVCEQIPPLRFRRGVGRPAHGEVDGPSRGAAIQVVRAVEMATAVVSSICPLPISPTAVTRNRLW